jgi:phosphoribosylglycinamide formyltransferase 2
LVTLRTQRLSAFELQARAILGLASDTIMISPGAAQMLYAGRDGVDAAPSVGALVDALAVPESDVRVFGQLDEPDSRRRLGVAVATAADVKTARERVGQVSAALRKDWLS